MLYEVITPTSYKTEKYAHHLALHFILPLKVPAPITGNRFRLSIYDSTYYVEMLHHKLSAISVTDNAAANCSIKLEAPHPPEDLSAYAASLDITAQSDDGLGEMFAAGGSATRRASPKAPDAKSLSRE